MSDPILDSAAQWVPIDDLEPWDQNPRANEAAVAEVASSIRRFGFASPIIAREEDRQVIAGHTRLKAARMLGLDRVPVRLLDIDPADARLLALADNKLGEIATWDDSLLADVLRELDQEGESLEGLGWTDDELAELLAMPDPDPEPPTEPEDDTLPEAPPALTQPGEVITIGRHTLHCGDCLEVMRALPDCSVDSIVTDPPYGLGFMGKTWDVSVPGLEWAEECLRVLKPGGHLVAFGGTRTVHRLTCALEDAGLEIRDCGVWVYWQGFPKSLDASKALDRQKDNREDTLTVTRWIADARDAAGLKNSEIDAHFGFHGMAGHWTSQKSQPAVPTLAQVPVLLKLLGSPEPSPNVARLLWELNAEKGKPGPNWWKREVSGSITKARAVGSASALPTLGAPTEYRSWDITSPATPEAKRWQGWGTGLKPSQEPWVLARKPLEGTLAENLLTWGCGALNIDGCRYAPGDVAWPGPGGDEPTAPVFAPAGRWPANLYHCPKPSRGEREEGCAELGPITRDHVTGRKPGSPGSKHARAGMTRLGEVRNHHPTVKPARLFRWLSRLVTPPGGVLLEPFAGSGTTLIAAEREGFIAIGIEREPAYCDITRARLSAVVEGDDL